MRKIIFLIGSILFLIQPLADAAPPTDIVATYDNEKGVLHLEITHTSHKLDKFYIRKVVVQKSKEENPQVLYFTRQNHPDKFITDVPLKAKAGDRITIEAYAKEGGFKEKSYTIPGPAKKAESKEKAVENAESETKAGPETKSEDMIGK